MSQRFADKKEPKCVLESRFCSLSDNRPKLLEAWSNLGPYVGVVQNNQACFRSHPFNLRLEND